MEQVYRNRIEVQDDGSSQIERYNQTVQDMNRLHEAATAAFDEMSDVASRFTSDIERTDPVVAALSAQIQELVSEGSSLEEAIDAATEGFGAYYSEGYTAGDMTAALALALSDVADQFGVAASEAENLAASEGDVTDASRGAENALNDVSSASDSAASSQNEAASSGVSLGSALDNVTTKAIAGAAAIKGIADEVREMSTAFIEDAAEQVISSEVIKRNAKDIENLDARMASAIATAQRFGITDSEVRRAMQDLVVITHSTAKSFSDLALAEDISIGKQIPLAAAVNIVRDAEIGRTRSLKALGIDLDANASKEEALAALRERFAGLAVTYAQTEAGQLAATKVAADESREALGEFFAQQPPGTFLDAFKSIPLLLSGDWAQAIEESNQRYASWGQKVEGVSNEASDAVGGMVASSIDAFDQIAGAYNDLAADLEVTTAEQVAIMRNGGSDAGASYQEELAKALAEGYPSVKQQRDNTIALFAVSGALAKAGGDGASSYMQSMVASLKAAKPSIAAELNSIIAMYGIAAGAASIVDGNKRGKPAAINLPNVNPFGSGGSGKSAAPQYVDIGDPNPLDMDNSSTGIGANTSSASKSASKSTKSGKSAKSSADKAKKEAERAQKEAERAEEEARRAKEAAEGEMQAVADSNARDQAADNSAAATQHLKDVTDAYDASLATLKDDLEGATDKLDDMREQTEETLHSLDASIRNEQGILKNLQDEAEDAYKPLIEGADKAHNRVDELSRAAARQAEIFQDAADALDDEQKSVDTKYTSLLAPFKQAAQEVGDELYNLAQEYAADLKPIEDELTQLGDKLYNLAQEQAAGLQPYKDELQQVGDALYALGEQERVAMTPLNERVEAKTDALDDEKRALTELSQGYENELIPLRKELADLDYAEQKDDRLHTLEEQSKSVANLTAKLHNLKAGTKEYNQTQRELAEAQKTLGRTEQKGNLEDRIKAIEDEKANSEQLAQERIRQHTEELRLITEQRDAQAQAFAEQRAALELQQQQTQHEMDLKQRGYDQERAALEARQQQLERERELKQRDYDQERANLEARQAANDRQAELIQREYDLETAKVQADKDKLAAEKENFDRKMRDMQAEAAEQARLADEALKKEQERQTIRQQATKDYLESLQNERNSVAQTASDAERDQGKIIEGIQDKITETGKAKNAATEAAQVTVDATKAEADALRDNIDLRKKQEDSQKAIADYAAAYHLSIEDAKKALDEMTPQVSTLADGASDAGKAINTEFAPAISGLKNTTHTELGEVRDEWVTLFGTTGSNGDIRKLLFAKDSTGFHTYLDSKTRLALGIDGYRGVWGQELGFVWDDVSTNILAQREPLAADIVTLVAALQDAAEDQFRSKERQASLGSAIYDYFKDAMSDASSRLGGYSASGGSSTPANIPVRINTGASTLSTLSTRNINVRVTVDGGSAGVNAANLPTKKGSYSAVARTIVLDIADELRAQGLIR